MELTEGAYEHLISNKLLQKLDELQKNSEKEGILISMDQAETGSMVVEYLSQLLYSRFSDDSISTDEKKELANRIIELIGNNEDSIHNLKSILAQVTTKTENKKNEVTQKNFIRPLSGFRVSNLFTGGQSQISLISEIERDIVSADRICIIVSFLRLSGINLIYDSLQDFCNKPEHQLRIITTTYCGITEAKAVERLSRLPNTEIRISYNSQIERLHAKSYIFERKSGMSTAYVGSSNLSKSAQTDGLEWNIRVTNVENPHIIKTALATFDIYWNSPNFEDYKKGGINRFYEATRREKNRSISTDHLIQYQILPHQKAILDRLIADRENGSKRNLIVAATGTGKTVISAFDYRHFCNHSPRNNRILFVAHREEILKQAIRTYRSVLSDANFGDLWVGNNRPNSIDHLFVSVQMFSSNYNSFFNDLPSSYYNYIVIDEAHHIVADSYRNIIEHFKPQILMGLTATPERQDQTSLLPDFDNHISAEIRLPKALEEGLLTPFQYLCISDITDLSDNSLMNGNKYIANELYKKLATTQRVNLIIDRLGFYLPDEHACKALCFCATQKHAEYMATEFVKAGFKASFLTSGTSNEQQRKEVTSDLASGKINYLFVVDIFNEGVDIPEIDTVLFLRPTESLTIFLQQLGRGLRLYPGKQLLTVFDFVGHLNNKYDYASRFTSLMLRSDKKIQDQVKNGFTFLPHGCSIHMEKKAQKSILENIKSAIYNKNRIIQELKRIGNSKISITDFLHLNGQDIKLLYRDNRCWTSLKREAGLCTYNDTEVTAVLQKNLKRLLHINRSEYLYFIRKIVQNKGKLINTTPSDEVYALMLYYALFQLPISKYNYQDIYEALESLQEYPLFLKEIEEITNYLLQNIEINTFSIGKGMPYHLEQYGCYTREEIFIIFGKQTEEKTMQGSVTGVFNFEDFNTEALFVTLNKSDADFSPSTMYNDYVIGENRFHWQSQNKDSHDEKSGQRFVNQKINQKNFLLFVREYKKDGYNNTCPFYCFGLVDYVRSYGDKPMNIEWEVKEPIMPKFIKAV